MELLAAVTAYIMSLSLALLIVWPLISRNTRTDKAALKDSFDQGYLEGFEKAQRTYAGVVPEKWYPNGMTGWMCKDCKTIHKTRQALREHRRKYHAKPKTKVAKKGSRRSLAGR